MSTTSTTSVVPNTDPNNLLEALKTFFTENKKVFLYIFLAIIALLVISSYIFSWSFLTSMSEVSGMPYLEVSTNLKPIEEKK